MTGDRPKLALLTNPLSGANRRYGGSVIALAQREGIILGEGREPGEIKTTLRMIAREQPEVLIVNGGDGTVRAVVAMLRRERIFEKEPILALLRGGSTNMIQNDAGLNGNPLRALKRLLREVRNEVPEECVRTHSPLKIQRTEGDFEEYGFFWSAGAIPRVSQSAQAGYAQGGVRGALGEFNTLVRTLKTLLKKKPTWDERIYPELIGWQRPVIDSDDCVPGSPRLFVFVTTLNKLILGLSPGSNGSGLKLVSLNYPYTRRDLFSFLRLRGRAPVDSGSFQCELEQALIFHVTSEWALDGEFFEASSADPYLRLTVADPFRFLIC